MKAVLGTRCRNAHMFAERGHTQPLGCAGFAHIVFRFKAKKIIYFSLSFALNEYERRRFRLYIFFASKRKRNPYFSHSFALSKYERRTLPASLTHKACEYLREIGVVVRIQYRKSWKQTDKFKCYIFGKTRMPMPE